MDKQSPPSSRKLGRTAVIVVALLAAMGAIVFVGMNIWHATEVAEDEATGQTRNTEHTPPNFVDRNDVPEHDPGVPADLTQSDQPQP
ncbi:hypothetical protein [Croceibacterium ferulae]|uniref:hypothetical protein n=1 Tax=Croceibacterium ferulae TaxID=1854641 RepID=UPI000EAC04C5|nr:hypothetical protein [Croceibacterium ferulae]